MRAHGDDVSHWNGYYHPQENPPRPINFTIQKLTEGVYRDPSYTILKEQIQPVPVKGGYHYFRGQWLWKAQMDTFLSQLDGYDFWSLDVEKKNNYRGLPALNQPYPGYVESIPLALEYLTKYADIPGLLYTGPGTWMDWLRPIWSDLVLYDLWVAHYWWKPNPEGIPNYYTIKGAETMRRDWKFWQYDANGQGGRGLEYGVGSRGLDLDVFNGDVSDLEAWAHPAPVRHCPTCGQVWLENAGG